LSDESVELKSEMLNEDKMLTGSKRLLEAGWLVTCFVAAYILIALISFDKADPSWSQTGFDAPVRNVGGVIGAYLSDLLFNFFGYLAYSIPFLLLFIGYLVFRQVHRLLELDYVSLALKIVGFILFYIGVTAVSSMNFDDIFFFSAGGIIGDMVSQTFLPLFSFVGSTLIFLGFIVIGFVLVTGISCITIVDATGFYTIKLCQYIGKLPIQIYQHYRVNGADKDASAVKTNHADEQRKEKEPVSTSNKTARIESENKIKLDDKSESAEFTQQESFTTKPKTEHIADIPIDLAKDDELEPFISIDDLMTVDTGDSVQSSVNPAEIDAAFEPVEKLSVADDKSDDEELTVTPSSAIATTEPFDKYHGMPSIELLDRPDKLENPVSPEELEQVSRLVEAKLLDFGVQAQVVDVFPGPVITRFELDLAPGVKVSKISNLSKDLARSLSAISVRVVEVIPGKSVIGLELPNKHREIVRLSEVIACPAFKESTSPLTMVLGKDIAGEPVVVDLAKMPHLLVAGTTGSGKSVGVNTMIVSLLYKSTPEQVRLIMIDPKMLELSVYEGIPHLLAEVVTDMKEAANALRWCVGEMERRYKLMSALGVRNLKGYNAKIKKAKAQGQSIADPLWQAGDSMDTQPPALDTLPSIVVIVDEFADMMMIVGKKVEELIARIAQKARAAGIHLILATQRPSVDVITGLIKANIPTRMAFQVSSRIDSRTILDQQGAEQLLGQGDMLYLPPGSGVPTRVHGAFVDDHEVHAVVNDWKSRGEPNYLDEILSGETDQEILLPGEEAESAEGDEVDALYDEAVAFVTETRRVSISSVQRKFRIGYNRAARIVEDMENQGVVSRPAQNGAREVLAPPPPKP
jgi:S-DNA-T family DNA segregation ATPase FtsK/SpoIIIE